MNEKVSDFKEFIEIINKLSTEEEIEDFVKKRINYLEENSQKKTIDTNNNGRLIGTINEGYINSDSPIVSSLMVDPFYLNDVTLYIEFVKHIRGKDHSNMGQIFYDLRDFTEIAFGFLGNQKIRESIYLEPRDQKISIGDFYKNNSALCSERSAAVQNIVEFCCINSFLVFGKMKVEDRVVSHAYNIFRTKTGTLILFDSTNPVALDINDKIGYAPAFTIIGEENIDYVKKVDFDFDYISNIHNSPINKAEKRREYLTCNYEMNLNVKH